MNSIIVISAAVLILLQVSWCLLVLSGATWCLWTLRKTYAARLEVEKKKLDTILKRVTGVPQAPVNLGPLARHVRDKSGETQGKVSEPPMSMGKPFVYSPLDNEPKRPPQKTEGS